ncbi:hypothetical protein RND71_038571 [Anisodus tanguticus]|uniref:Uncharacterized protein n=1 Tax=Anisodus tanguticus TaxID=243964 RepID=A0AAE1QZW8_9SOLA|nr:hypothetical protein RND71_038571 [Anisodus tanguticus]
MPEWSAQQTYKVDSSLEHIEFCILGMKQHASVRRTYKKEMVVERSTLVHLRHSARAQKVGPSFEHDLPHLSNDRVLVAFSETVHSEAGSCRTWARLWLGNGRRHVSFSSKTLVSPANPQTTCYMHRILMSKLVELAYRFDDYHIQSQALSTSHRASKTLVSLQIPKRHAICIVSLCPNSVELAYRFDDYHIQSQALSTSHRASKTLVSLQIPKRHAICIVSLCPNSVELAYRFDDYHIQSQALSTSHRASKTLVSLQIPKRHAICIVSLCPNSVELAYRFDDYHIQSQALSTSHRASEEGMSPFLVYLACVPFLKTLVSLQIPKRHAICIVSLCPNSVELAYRFDDYHIQSQALSTSHRASKTLVSLQIPKRHAICIVSLCPNSVELAYRFDDYHIQSQALSTSHRASSSSVNKS